MRKNEASPTVSTNNRRRIIKYLSGPKCKDRLVFIVTPTVLIFPSRVILFFFQKTVLKETVPFFWKSAVGYKHYYSNTSSS